MLLIDDLLLAAFEGGDFITRTLLKVAQEQWTDDAPVQDQLLALQVQLDDGSDTDAQSLEPDAALLRPAAAVWTQTPNSMIGIEVFLDGNSLGTAQIFANPSGVHLPVVPVILPVKLSYGAHKIVLAQSTPPTTCDTNDYYTVTLMY